MFSAIFFFFFSKYTPIRKEILDRYRNIIIYHINQKSNVHAMKLKYVHNSQMMFDRKK